MRELKPLITTAMLMLFALVSMSTIANMSRGILNGITEVSPQGGTTTPTPTEVPSPDPSPPTTASTVQTDIPDPIKWGTVGTVLIIIAAVIVGLVQQLTNSPTLVYTN